MLRTLSTIRRSDAPLCGGKAACLGELASRGYLIPDSLVLPTTVYRDFLVDNALGDLVAERSDESVTATPSRLIEIEREIVASFTAAALRAGVQSEIRAWTDARARMRFAVRSSATNEDLPGASFAGQYNSFLTLQAAEVCPSVLLCFASLFSARAALYRRRKGLHAIGSMAVIVQEMVRSDHAGVVFTHAPRRPGTLLVEGAPGLGEGVVSGTVSPSRYYLNRTTLSFEDTCERHAIDIACVRAIARQALAIEADLGGAQDIEYGVEGDIVRILQARPAAAVTV